MNPQRKTALAMMLILAVFATAVTAQLFALQHREKKAGVLAETELTQLKDKIKADPKDEASIERARVLDVQMRQDYFRTQRQYKAADYLLMAALIGFLISAGLFLEAGPQPLPDVMKLNQGVPREVLLARARRGALAVGCVAALFMAGIAMQGIRHRGDIPAVEPQTVQATEKGGAVTATSATLASAPKTTETQTAAATPAATATPKVDAKTTATVVVAQATPAATPAATPEAATPKPAGGMNFKDNWPNFRGAGNLGIASAGDYPTAWSVKEKKNVAWAVDVPAEGKSSPIVWGDKVFLSGGDKGAHHVMAFDRATGKLLWNTPLQVPAGAAEMEVFEDTGFAAPTPATDGKNVYALFASGLLAAVDFSGKQVWAKDLKTTDSQYGLASSLIMHEGTLIALLDQGPEAEAQKSRLVGFDPATGNEKWATKRPVPNSWASPSIIKSNGKSELITCANPLVISYDPASGKELWRVDGYGGEIAPSPTFDGQRVIVANDSAVMLAIKPGGSGDVTATQVAWKGEECLPDIASPVSDGKRILLVRASGELGCFEAADGKKAWEKSLECSFSASPIVAGKLAYLCGEDGVMRVIDMSAPEFKELSRGDVGEPIKATPAFGDGRIYIRGAKRLYCIAQPQGSPAADKAPAMAATATTATQAASAASPATTSTAAKASAAPTTTTAAATQPAAASGAYKDNWPNFRGEGNLGVAAPGDYPAAWSAKDKQNVAWTVEIPAEGKSSPIVWGDKVFLSGGDKGGHHVMAFDRATGKLLWNTPLQVPAGAAEMEVFEDTGFAAPTPATDGKNVYALFASGLLAAVDFSGKQVWAKDLKTTDSQYGLASSLIMHEGTLIALLDQGPEAEAQKSRLVGFDPATGNEKWATKRPVPNSWASPSIIKLNGKSELITCANPLVISYDPASGKELWRVDGYGGEIAPSPTFDGQRVIVANDSAVMLAIRPGGSGDVTASQVAWKGEECLPDIASPVSDGKRVLLVRASGELGCFEAADGKKAWEKSLECSFSASPIVAGKLAYLCGEDGVTRIIDLSAAEFKELSRGDVGEPIKATPAFGDGRIYIRGSKHLFCIGARP